MTNQSLPRRSNHGKTFPLAPMGLSLFDIEIENGFAFDSQEYADLFAASTATPFQHPIWLDRFYARLVPELHAEPLIIVARRRGEERPAMVLPLVRRRLAGALRVIEFADLRVSDYASPVGAAQTLQRIVGDDATVDRIRKALRPFDLLFVKNIRHDESALERLLGVPARRSMKVSAHAVPLASPYSAWRNQKISASYRKKLDKKTRQLHRKGDVRFARSTDAESITATLRSMREFRRQRFEDRGGDLLQDERYFQFYHEVAMRGRDAFAQTYTLSMNSRPIAGVLGLSHAGRLLVILGGFDQATYRSQSIGTLMFQAVAENAIVRGETELDFTIGDEPYKRLFGVAATPMWMVAKSGSPVGAVARLAIERLPWARAMAKRLLGQPGRVASPAASTAPAGGAERHFESAPLPPIDASKTSPAESAH